MQKSMLIISCSKGIHLGQKIAKKLKAAHSKLYVDKFPDGELYIRFNAELKNKKVVLVQSFYGNVQDLIIEVLFAAITAKELGAEKVILAAPYFPYFRQDKRFKSGECVSIKAVSDIIDRHFDGIIVIDPHLHRTKKIEDIFKIKSKKLTANKLIASCIQRNFKAPILVGPDVESYKWARKVAEMIGVESYIYRKKRYSSHKVIVRLNKKINIKGKDVVIVDDIISTGHTMLETIKNLERLRPKSVSCICVHGLLIGGIISILKRKKIRVISSNTIPSSACKIDVSGLIAEGLRQHFSTL